MGTIIFLAVFVSSLRFLMSSLKFSVVSALVGAGVISILVASIIEGFLRSLTATGMSLPIGLVVVLLMGGAGYLGWWYRGKREDNTPFKPWN